MLKNRNPLRISAAIFMTLTGLTFAQNNPVGGGFANPKNAPNGPGGPPPKATPFTLSGVYTLSGKTAKSASATYTSDKADVSAIYVKSTGDLTLTDPTITTSADSSSDDNSSFYGLNAAVLATRGSKIKITGGTISTTGAGANGVFATGASASITLSKTTINATGSGAHGVMATAGGALTLADVTITTTGAHAAAIATDRGGGNITVKGGSFNTSGEKSPAIYSTGIIKVTGATMTATGAEAAVIEGSNSITLTDTDLTGQKSRGVMIYQSFSGDAYGGSGTFTMTRGSLTAADGPLFYITNTTANILLSNVTLNASSGTLIDASAGEWGRSGFNGGKAFFTADHETLKGDVKADLLSSISIKLTDRSTLEGTVTNAAVSIDSTSIWTVTADSTITVLADSLGVIGKNVRNISGNGHTVYYDASLADNRYLGGKTYDLASGGKLQPTAGTATNTRNNQPGQNNNGLGNNGLGNNGQSGNGFGGGGGGGRGGGGRGR